VKNWPKTISIEEKLVAKSWVEKDEWIVDITLDTPVAAYVQFMIMLIEFKKSAELGTKVFVCVAWLPQSYQNETYKTKDVSILHLYCIRNK
jgi:hypothetical protein